MGPIESFLKSVAKFQYEHTKLIALFFILFSIFMLIGAFKISMESDINKEMPQQLSVYRLNDRVKDTFGGQDSFIILISLKDDLSYDGNVNDIRDPKIINFIIGLSKSLSDENSIDKVVSIASFFPNGYKPKSLSEVKYLLQMNPELNRFFSRDYKETVLFVNSDVGSSEEKVNALNQLIELKLQNLGLPENVKVMKTGTPSMRVTVFEYLGRDALYTLILAAIIILFLLFFAEQSFTKGLLGFFPLLFGLLWTAGTLGWLGIKLSIATVGLGAMILGLGVEYGVFMLTRYKEARKKGLSQREALLDSVPFVGHAMIGSGLTTIVGFLALTLSIMPLMQHLGISLAIGIFYSLIAAIFLAPVIFILEERLEAIIVHKKFHKIKSKKESLGGGLL